MNHVQKVPSPSTSLKLVLLSYCASLSASHYIFSMWQSSVSFDGLVTQVHSLPPWQGRVPWPRNHYRYFCQQPPPPFLPALRVVTMLELMQLFWVEGGVGQVRQTGSQTSDLCRVHLFGLWQRTHQATWTTLNSILDPWCLRRASHASHCSSMLLIQACIIVLDSCQ